jgi:hypothetical protein
MAKWMQMAEEDNVKRKEIEEKGKQKKLEVKDFLLMQMGGLPVESGQGINNNHSSTASIAPTINTKKGKAMNMEELRINK